MTDRGMTGDRPTGVRRPIGVGLVGYGLAGAVLHAPIIEAIADYRIVAVATSRAEAGERRDRPVVVPDIDALLAVEGVELVVVVAPNAAHAPIATAALRAGRHVVIDKPMAPSAADCDALIDLAARERRVLSVYHNRRWDGDFQAAKREVETADPVLFEGCWDRFRPDAAPGWRNAEVAGAGLLWDLGPHMIDQAIQLFGWPDSMVADVAVQRAGARADDYFALTLRYGERRVVLSASTLVAATRPRFALHGPMGSWWTEGLDPVEAALRRGDSPSVAGFLETLEPIPAFRAVSDGGRIADPVDAGDPFAFYRQMAAAIRGRGPVPVDPVDARNVVAIIDAAHKGETLPARRNGKDQDA